MRTIIGIILFGIGVGLAAFVAWPQWDRIDVISADTERIRALGTELDGLITRRDELLAKRAEIDPLVLAKLDAIAPRGPETRQVVVTLETLAQQNGMKLMDVDAAVPSSVAGVGTPTEQVFTSAPVGFTVGGSFAAFQRFLASIEENLRIIDVMEFSLASPESTQVLFPIKSSVYYRQ